MSLQIDPKLQPPTANDGQLHAVGRGLRARPETKPDTWLKLARSAYLGSTQYYNNNYRQTWDDSIRAFFSQHAAKSKYNSPQYAKRSNVYRPRTRTIIRKNEAAAAAAFFSNMDVVSVSSSDQTSKAKAASAAVMKELLQYRLTKSIPWYLTVLGGLQDAQTVGVVCGHVHWEFEEDEFEDAPEPAPLTSALGEAEAPAATPGPLPVAAEAQGEEYPRQGPLPEGAFAVEIDHGPAAGPGEAARPEPKVKKDRPRVDLVPIENLRFDPASDWTDPVNSSPYLIHLMPMRVQDVIAKMDEGKWHPLDEETIVTTASSSMNDTTRLARTQNRQDPTEQDATDIQDYTVVWVQRHIHRRYGEDWEFYTLSDEHMLTTPRPLTESTLHGRRPYVVGCCILEAHRPIPSSVPELGRGLQDETNEIANARLDNVKFALNKAWFAKRGKDVDIVGLVRNVPGRVVMLDDPKEDVVSQEWQDVTASSFQEQQGLLLEMDELLGNFNPAQMMAVINSNSPAKNMSMLGHSSATLVEYLLRTFVVTFVEPVLRLLVLLEQEYESDATVIALASKNAKLAEKFGMDAVTDELLREELTLTVNVGMGATDPMAKLQKLLLALQSLGGLYKLGAPMWANMEEVQKEVYGLLGYSDGSRFMGSDNPQVKALQQQVQQLMMALNQMRQKAGELKLQTARERNQADAAISQQKNQTILMQEALRQSSMNKREVYKQHHEAHNSVGKLVVDIHKSRMKLK